MGSLSEASVPAMRPVSEASVPAMVFVSAAKLFLDSVSLR